MLEDHQVAKALRALLRGHDPVEPVGLQRERIVVHVRIHVHAFVRERIHGDEHYAVPDEPIGTFNAVRPVLWIIATRKEPPVVNSGRTPVRPSRGTAGVIVFLVPRTERVHVVRERGIPVPLLPVVVACAVLHHVTGKENKVYGTCRAFRVG